MIRLLLTDGDRSDSRTEETEDVFHPASSGSGTKMGNKEPTVFNCFAFGCDPAVSLGFSLCFREEWEKLIWCGSGNNKKRQKEEGCLLWMVYAYPDADTSRQARNKTPYIGCALGKTESVPDGEKEKCSQKLLIQISTRGASTPECPKARTQKQLDSGKRGIHSSKWGRNSDPAAGGQLISEPGNLRPLLGKPRTKHTRKRGPQGRPWHCWCGVQVTLWDDKMGRKFPNWKTNKNTNI